MELHHLISQQWYRWMFPVAIATGNTFVLKPSEKDPSLALGLAKLLKEAGFDGVFNVVKGTKNRRCALNRARSPSR